MNNQKNILQIKQIITEIDINFYWKIQSVFSRGTGSMWFDLYQKEDRKEFADLLTKLEKWKKIIIDSEIEEQVVGLGKDYSNSLYNLKKKYLHNDEKAEAKINELAHRLSDLTYGSYEQGYGDEYQ